jgi:hypothetical protein
MVYKTVLKTVHIVLYFINFVYFYSSHVPHPAVSDSDLFTFLKSCQDYNSPYGYRNGHITLVTLVKHKRIQIIVTIQLVTRHET